MDSGTASLIGVVVGASITSLREWFVVSRSRRNGAVYLVSRIAPLLDDFVAKCASVSLDKGQEDQEGQVLARFATPTLDLKDLDVDWKTLPADLMRELLEIPFRIEVAEKAIAEEDESADSHDNSATFLVRREEYGQLGLATHDLMLRLLKHTKLSARTVRSWNPVSVIQAELKEIAVRRAIQEKANHQWFQTASPAPPLPS